MKRGREKSPEPPQPDKKAAAAGGSASSSSATAPAGGASSPAAPDHGPLDRTPMVVHRTLTKAQSKVSTMHSFVESVNEQLCATGLAVVSLESAPRVLRHLWARPADAVEFLSKLLGARYQLNTYSYSFEKTEGVEGAYHAKYKRQGKPFTPAKIYEYAAAQDKEGPFAGLPKTGDFTDEVYWSKLEAAAASGELIHYPADIHASLLGTPEVAEGIPKGWNMAAFDSDTDLLRACMPHWNFADDCLPGCTDSMLYVGAAGTSFLLHAEDQNLYSCNYLLAGAPKVWNGVPSGYYSKVVELVRTLFKDVKLTQQCPQAVMHKRFMIRPDVLRAHGIPTCRLIQRPGDLVITGPGAFHFGYNTGFNIAEATNLATSEWWTGKHLHAALAAGSCTCKEAPRFTLPEEAVKEALAEEGERFGITPEDLE